MDIKGNNAIGSKMPCNQQRCFYFFGHSDYIKYSLSDILEQKNVWYVDFFQSNPRIIRFLLSNRVPSILKQFFWSKMAKRTKGFRFLHEPSICDIFVFYEKNFFSRDADFLSYLKRLRPNAKLFFVITNLVSDAWLKTNKDTFNFITKSNYYDDIITFNKPDAIQYGFKYFQFVNSKRLFDSKDSIPESDVFFCGRDKGRQQLVEDVYRHLSTNGLSCNFILIKDETSNREPCAGIKFLTHPIPNEDVLRNMSKSKCILDVAFDKTSPGQSLRFSEAIAYEKLLLTDNPFTVENELFNPAQMIVFKQALDINVKELKEKMHRMDYLPTESVSPKNLMMFLLDLYNQK